MFAFLQHIHSKKLAEKEKTRKHNAEVKECSVKRSYYNITNIQRYQYNNYNGHGHQFHPSLHIQFSHRLSDCSYSSSSLQRFQYDYRGGEQINRSSRMYSSRCEIQNPNNFRGYSHSNGGGYYSGF